MALKEERNRFFSTDRNREVAAVKTFSEQWFILMYCESVRNFIGATVKTVMYSGAHHHFLTGNLDSALTIVECHDLMPSVMMYTRKAEDQIGGKSQLSVSSFCRMMFSCFTHLLKSGMILNFPNLPNCNVN